MLKLAEGVWTQEAAGLVRWGAADIAFLQREAENTEKRRARILAHEQEDRCHQMLIAFCADSRNPMHSHARPESLYIIKGAMVVRLATGKELLLREGEYLRIPPGVEHQPEPLCDCVILETAEK